MTEDLYATDLSEQFLEKAIKTLQKRSQTTLLILINGQRNWAKTTKGKENILVEQVPKMTFYSQSTGTRI